MTLLTTTSQSDHALAYAAQQNRWERGVLWLAGIVCVSQLLMAPEGIWFWGRMVLGWFFPGSAPLLSSRTSFEELVIMGIGRMLILPLMQLATAWLCIRMMMGNERARRILFYLALATVLTHLAWSCTSIAWTFCRESPSRPWTPFGMAQRVQHDSMVWGNILGEAVVRNYPLLLFALVVRRQDEQLGRGIGAAIIWALTASACALVALPTTIDWVTHAYYNYYNVTGQVFAIVITQSWTNSIFGIGVAAGSAACLSIWLLIAYTLLKGPRGRASLMICAALLAVFAMAVPGAMVASTIADMADIFIQNGLSIRLLRQIQPLAERLAVLAAAGAFPLALRMALSLSDVQDQLDGLRNRSNQPQKQPLMVELSNTGAIPPSPEPALPPTPSSRVS